MPFAPTNTTVTSLPASIGSEKLTVQPTAQSTSCVQPTAQSTSCAYPHTVANLLPQIPHFDGSEQKDGETVQDWVDHFESAATLATTSYSPT